jgi:hypothetical protein
VTELWFNLRPMLLEVGVPALFMGFSFPLANALIQRRNSRSAAARRCCISRTPRVRVAGSLVAGFRPASPCSVADQHGPCSCSCGGWDSFRSMIRDMRLPTPDFGGGPFVLW